MIYNLRTLSKAKPPFAFVTTDIENAFGNVTRRLSLAALRNSVPALAPIMALLWRNGSTRILAPKDTQNFALFDVTEGVFQGECLSTAIFCIFLHAVVSDFRSRIAQLQHRAKQLRPNEVIVQAYVDDIVLACDPEILQQVWPAWLSTLKDHGLTVALHKCTAWVPQDKEPSALMRSIFPLELITTAGLSVLGSAATGAHSTILTCPGSHYCRCSYST